GEIGVERGISDVGPPSVVPPVDGLPAPDDQQHHVRAVVSYLAGPSARPRLAFWLRIARLGRIPKRAATDDATAHEGVVDEGEPRRRREIAHQRPPHR